MPKFKLKKLVGENFEKKEENVEYVFEISLTCCYLVHCMDLSPLQLCKGEDENPKWCVLPLLEEILVKLIRSSY